MAELIVRGGTVVTAERSFRADVTISDGRISEVGERIGEFHPEADVLDARDLLVLPGCVDVHTHTRLPSEDEPDRFFQDSVAAAFGGTTTFLAFNNPGTGISQAGSASLLAGLDEFRSRTANEAAVDFGLSAVITGQQPDPLSELAELIARGVPTAKAFMVYDFRLPDERLFAALQTMGRYGGMLQVHCENATIIDALVSGALHAGQTECRHHAACRPPYAEAEATHRAIALARAAEASVYVVHLSCADALAEVVAAKARGWPVYAETCPHYLTRTDDAYGVDDEAEVIKSVISPPLRSDVDRQALWLGLARGGLDLVATDHVPDRLAVEKAIPAPPFPQISNGAPGIETLLSLVYSAGVGAGRLSPERLVDVLATTPARLFGMSSKGAVEVGRDADLVLFDPAATRTIRQEELHHTSDFTPYEGVAVRGAIRGVLLRGEAVILDGRFVGRRGAGRFLERQLAPTEAARGAATATASPAS
ncbi:MAG TPA: dihydropyrimidinase [Candidatus Limnocylindria bacterium]|nr:dihydropyrimidinase [Candidatus Limnocylindria bacterium]